GGPAPAGAGDPRFEKRSRAPGALPPRLRQWQRPPLRLAAVRRTLAVPRRIARLNPQLREPTMSVKHPIIAITGSSGAGTSTVMQSFQHIFRREQLKAQIVEGDSFHRYDRLAMRAEMKAQEEAGNRNFS